MSKRIIAIALAVLFIVTAFTACKSKVEMTEINGKEYPLATDRDGNTIVNEDNQIALIVTERNGEPITFADGEPQTHWLQLSGDYVTDKQLNGKLYKFIVPSGWEATTNGRMNKKGTKDKCYIKFSDFGKLDKGETLESYLELIDSQDQSIADAFADDATMDELIKQNPTFAEYKGSTYTIEKGTAQVSGIKTTTRTHKIVNGEGKVVHYAEAAYFVYEGNLYALNYACEGGEGYDEEFNFTTYLGHNFTFKEPKK